MRGVLTVLPLLAAALPGYADFCYTMTQKSGPGNGQVFKYLVKGSKRVEVRGRITTILDFEAQTLTTIDHNVKGYLVVPFSSLKGAASGADIDVQVSATGQKKAINGFNASQVLLTVKVEPAADTQGFKGQIEMELWLAKDVPGSQEMLKFYKKNAAAWPATGYAGNPGMARAVARLQQIFVEMDGVPVMQVVRARPSEGSAPQNAQMSQALAQLEALAKSGGPGAAGAQQALDRLNGMTGGSGSLFDTTLEAGNFSDAAIPDSEFAIPAGYRRMDQ